MKRMILALSLFVAAPAWAKAPSVAVAQATQARDVARRAVLKAAIEMAKAKALLAQAQVMLTQAKYDAGATRAEAEAE